MKITIAPSKKHGLEIFKVYVNGIYVSEFLSLAGARVKAQELTNKLKG